MLGESDHVASQEKEKLALQRVAEIRRLAVQLHIKQNMNSSAAADGAIKLLRKELIDKTKNVLVEFEISESYDFKLEFNEKSMPELVSTLTKLRKFVISQIRLASRINTLQNASLSRSFSSSCAHDNIKSPSVMIRDLSNVCPSPSANKSKLSSDVVETEEVKCQQQVLSDLAPVRDHKESRVPAANAFRHQNTLNLSGKEEEKSLTRSELGSHVDTPDQGRRDQTGQVSPQAETQSLEDSIDEIDLRVREQEMLRLRHFRELAEQRVEEKVQRIQNIMNETNTRYGPKLSDRHVGSTPQPMTQHKPGFNMSSPPAPPQTPPRESRRRLSPKHDDNTSDLDQNKSNPLETSLDALMSLADTPLSKLRQEENEIILYQNQEAQAKNHDPHYANSGFDSTLLAPATPNQMPVPIPINPSTPYAMPSPPKPFQQSLHPAVTANGTKQRRNAVPQNSLLASATKATHHPNITSATLKSDLLEQHSRLKQRRKAVPKKFLEASANTATRRQNVSKIRSSELLRDGLDEHQNVVPQNLFDTSTRRSANQRHVTSRLNVNTDVDRMKDQGYSNLVDPEDEENSGNHGVLSGGNLNIPANQITSVRNDNDDFKLRNPKVNFYDSKVQLGDISKVTYYESSGIDTSYGGDTIVSHQQEFRSPIPIETTVKKNAIVSPSDKNENCVTNVHISRRGSVTISQHEESYQGSSRSKEYTQHSNSYKSRLPLPRSIHVKPEGARRTAEITHKKNLLLQSSVERKYDSTYYPASPATPYGKQGRLFELSINDESDSFLPGRIDKHNNSINSNGPRITERRKVKHTNQSSASIVLQRPGESFAIAERRVRERMKKKKDAGLIKKREDALRKARLKKLEESTRKAREGNINARKMKNKKHGYAALAKKKAAEIEDERKKKRAEAARKRTLERLKKKKIEMARKKKIEDAKKKEDDEKKWRDRDEKMKIFKERRAERIRQKKMIEERAARNASKPKPQWNSTTSNNNTIGASVESEAAVDRHKAHNNKGDTRMDDKKSPKKIRKYSKPRPHQLFPKNMQKKRSSGLVPQRVPTVMKMQHRQHVDKKDRAAEGGYNKIQQKGNGLVTRNSSMNELAKVPTMMVMAHKQHIRKKHAGRKKVMGVNAEIEGTEEEVTAMDDSIMSFEDVEKWIDEQERYFGKSGSNFDEGTGKDAEKHKDLDLINFSEEKNVDLSSPPCKQDGKKSTKTEDDKFLDSLLMDAGSGIGSILSPFKMEDF